MPSVVHFAPSLVSGGLLVGKTNVNTQVTGLVDVTVDYICRTADLDTHLEKFFLDAPPPVFPSRTISTTALVEGKLFMVNYGVNDQYGVATISARYAGVTSKPIKPYATFEYIDFAVRVPVYVNTTGAFGSQQFIGYIEANNDFSAPPGAMTVRMRGRAEAISYAWATLDTSSPAPLLLPPAPSEADAFAELELVGGGISVTEFEGEFGYAANAQLPLFTIGDPNAANYTPPKVASLDVLYFVAQANGLPPGKPSESFQGLTMNDWRARGVVPRAYYSISRRTQAVTPSVYVREIEYAPTVRGY
jgi:hypothetical protein